MILNIQTKYSYETVAAQWPNGNIILTGASGSGKSTIGRQLSKLIGMGFVDLDDQIERVTSKTIAQLFETLGEDGFREIEAKVLDEMSSLRSHVIAVGGGALLNSDSMRLAKTFGPIVWIQSNPVEVARRLFKRISEIEKRPLFKDLVTEENHLKRQEKIQERIQVMMKERSSYYAQAEVVLDGSYVTPELAAQHLKDILLSEGLIEPDKNRFASWHRKEVRP